MLIFFFKPISTIVRHVKLILNVEIPFQELSKVRLESLDQAARQPSQPEGGVRHSHCERSNMPQPASARP